MPFAPSPFRVTFHVKAGSVDVTKELPVEYRYVKDIYFGDKRMELNVVPDFSVRITPTLAVIPAPAGAAKADRSRDPRLRHQWHQGRGQSNGCAGVAGGLEMHARHRAAELYATKTNRFPPASW